MWVVQGRRAARFGVSRNGRWPGAARYRSIWTSSFRPPRPGSAEARSIAAELCGIATARPCSEREGYVPSEHDAN
jgi:hypothetical protein